MINLRSIQGTSRNTVEWVEKQLLEIGDPDLEVRISLDGGQTTHLNSGGGNNLGRFLFSHWSLDIEPETGLVKENCPRYQYRGTKIPEAIRVMNLWGEPWRLVEIAINARRRPVYPITRVEAREDCCVLIYDRADVQGWEYLYDNPKRIDEYIDAYYAFANKLGDQEKYILMRLILGSCRRKLSLDDKYWGRIKPILIEEYKLNLTSLNWWASWDLGDFSDPELTDYNIGISPRIREVCDVLLAEGKVRMAVGDDGDPEMVLV